MAIVGGQNTHARTKFRGDATRRERRKFARRVSSIFRARVCISPAPQSPSPKLETTRSLQSTETGDFSIGEDLFSEQISDLWRNVE